MHGQQYTQKIKENAEKFRKETVGTHAAEYSIVIPAGQYAVFYSEPIVSTDLQIQVYIYAGLELYSTFTVVMAYPDLAEIENVGPAPVEYAMTAATSPYGSNNGPYKPVQTITPTPTGVGIMIAIYTGEIDEAGQPIAQNVYMEIKDHPE